MVKVFVTGAGGFLTTHLVQDLLKEGCEITCTARPEKNLDHIEKLPIKIVRADLRKRDSLKGIIPKGSIVFHCYSLSPGAHASKENYYKENILSTKNLLAECEASKIKKLVYTSSASVIGTHGPEIREDSKPLPDGYYGKSKLVSERLVKNYYKKTGIPTLILRLSTLYGPCMHPRSSARKLLSTRNRKFFPVIGKGDNPFEFSYIKNVSWGVMTAAKMWKKDFGLFNIGDTEKRTVNDLLRTLNPYIKLVSLPLPIALILGGMGDLITAITGKRFPFRLRTVRGLRGGWVTNCEAAINQLGLKQQYSFEEGLKETYHWLENESKTYKYHN